MEDGGEWKTKTEVYTTRHEVDRSTDRRSTRRKIKENDNLMRRPQTGKTLYRLFSIRIGPIYHGGWG